MTARAFPAATRLKLATASEVAAFVRVADRTGAAGGLARPKCLLLHGNPRSARDWEHVVPHLVDVADVAAIDLPGFGASPRPGPGPAFLTLDRLAEHAIAAADALGWREPIVLVGHSHGSGVAQVAAARFPERVAGLVLIGTLGAPAHASYRLLALPGAEAFVRLAGRMLRNERLRPLSRVILRRTLSDIFAPEPVPGARLERELAELAAHPEILVSMVQVALGDPCATLLASAPNIRCPTLFIHGERDALVAVRYARAIHDRILDAGGNSRFQIIPNAGHMLIEYQAGDVANAIAGRSPARSSPSPSSIA